MLHVNPKLREKGLLAVFNPLDRPLERSLRVSLYYTGLADTARVREEGGPPSLTPLGRDSAIDLPVRVPAGAMKWFTFE